MPSSGQKLVDGATLTLASTVSLGQPFEVWKTRMARHRAESTADAFVSILRQGGLMAFYKGTGPKLFESASKGGVLLVAKDAANDSVRRAGVSQTTAGFVAGAAGGVAQTAVMGPSTFLVTAMVLGKEGDTVTAVMSRTWREKGLLGFYSGGSAIAFRQATNWASRVGFTEAMRSRIAALSHGDPKARLTVREEMLAGVLGGVLSCWNHPLEVARVEMQARAIAGESELSMLGVLRNVHSEYGARGLFQGLLPRMGLNMWLTLFMVSGANVLKQAREGELFSRGKSLASSAVGQANIRKGLTAGAGGVTA